MPGPQIEAIDIHREQELLGRLLFNNPTIEEMRRFRADQFKEPFHRRLFIAILRSINGGRIAGPLEMADRFKYDPAFKDMGGLSYLTDLIKATIESPDASRSPQHVVRMNYDDAIRIFGQFPSRTEPSPAAPTADSIQSEAGPTEIADIEHALDQLLRAITDTPKPPKTNGARAFHTWNESKWKASTTSSLTARSLTADPVGEALRAALKPLGQRLYEIGGCDLMDVALERVAQMDQSQAGLRALILDRRWSGVGGEWWN